MVSFFVRIASDMLLSLAVVFLLLDGSLSILSEKCNDNMELKSNALRLKRDLLCGYDRKIRPVLHHSNETTVSLGLYPIHFYMYEDRHELYTTAWLIMNWTDEFLKWNPSDYEGLTIFSTDTSTIWVPELAVENSINPLRTSFDTGLVSVMFNGQAYTALYTVLSSHCELDFTLWPYDFQTCHIVLLSRSNAKSNVELNLLKYKASTVLKYHSSSKWKLLSVDATYNVSSGLSEFQYVNGHISTINYKFVLQRHTSMSHVAILNSAIVLPIVLLSTFWLDYLSSSRFNIIGLVFFCNIYHFQYLMTRTTNNGMHVPKIVEYCQWCIGLTVLSIIMTVALRVISKLSTGPHQLHQLSGWISSNRYAQSLMLIDVDYKDDRADETEDESSLVRNGKSFQQWRVLSIFIDRVSFILFSILYMIIFMYYFPG